MKPSVTQQSARAVTPTNKGWRDRRFIVSTGVLALVFPLSLLVNIFRTGNESQQRALITVLFALLGATMLLGTGDAYRHQMMVEYYYTTISFNEFLRELWQILTFQLTDSGARDVYMHVVSYFFGGILGMPALFFPFIGMVYGYFFAGSVLHVLRNARLGKMNYVLLGLVVYFLLMKGPEGVQTVRTWTGLWVLVYACLKYYETRRIRYLLLMFVPPFIHIGYFVMCIPAWIVLAFGSRPLIYSVLVAASSFSAFLPSEPTMELIATTERGASSVQAYQLEQQRDRIDDLSEFVTQTNWYNAYRRSGLHRWAPIILVLALFASGAYSRIMNSYQQRVFSIGVLTLAFSNLTWFLYAVHNRTVTIASIFLLAGFLLARFAPDTAHRFRGLPPYYQWGLHLSLLLWFPLILFFVSMTFDRISVFAFISPILVFVDPELNMSIKEFLNWLLGRG